MWVSEALRSRAGIYRYISERVKTSFPIADQTRSDNRSTYQTSFCGREKYQQGKSGYPAQTSEKPGKGILIAAWIFDFLLTPIGIILSIIEIVHYKGNKGYRGGCIASLIVATVLLFLSQTVLSSGIAEGLERLQGPEQQGYVEYVSSDSYDEETSQEVLAENTEENSGDSQTESAGSTSYYLNTGMSIVKALYFIVPENAEQYSLIRENKPTARIDFTQEEIGTEPFEYAAGPDTMDITESTAFDVSKFKGHETKKVYFGTMIEPYVSENGNMKLYLYSDYEAEEPFSEIGVLAE